MSVGSWLRGLFGKRYQPTTPPRPDLTPEEDVQRREQVADGPADPRHVEEPEKPDET